MKYLIAMNAFKGSLTSKDLNQMLEAYISQSPGHKTKKILMSDGGEGFLDALESNNHLSRFYIKTFGPLMDPIETYALLDEKRHRAYVESAKIIGLSLLSGEKANPYQTTSYGLGIVIKKLLDLHVKSIIVGLGGSATNDGGTGMLKALGVKFLDKRNQPIENMDGQSMANIGSFDLKTLDHRVNHVHLTIATDVDNPLLGPEGATYTYGKQKGASLEMIKHLEASMINYARLTQDMLGKPYHQLPGSGAAGGLGFAFMTFLKAHKKSGFGLLSNILDIEHAIKWADLVITGEGRLDKQSLFGKAPYQIALLAKRYHTKVMGIFGKVDIKDPLRYFDEVYAIVPDIASLEEALLKPKLHFYSLLKTIKIPPKYLL